MGLFDFLKKKEAKAPVVNNEQTHETEFDRDIRELLAREDITCRPEICEAEFKKAEMLLKTPTQECVHRAYDIMGNLAAQFEYIPAIMWMGDFTENVMQDLKQAVYWYKKAADMGDGNGARNYADMLMSGRGVQQNPREAFSYYAMAADKGVPEAAFVLGEFLRNAGDRDNAIKAYQQAVDGGYLPAQQRIDQMKKGAR